MCLDLSSVILHTPWTMSAAIDCLHYLFFSVTLEDGAPVLPPAEWWHEQHVSHRVAVRITWPGTCWQEYWLTQPTALPALLASVWRKKFCLDYCLMSFSFTGYIVLPLTAKYCFSYLIFKFSYFIGRVSLPLVNNLLFLLKNFRGSRSVAVCHVSHS